MSVRLVEQRFSEFWAKSKSLKCIEIVIKFEGMENVGFALREVPVMKPGIVKEIT